MHDVLVMGGGPAGSAVAARAGLGVSRRTSKAAAATPLLALRDWSCRNARVAGPGHLLVGGVHALVHALAAGDDASVSGLFARAHAPLVALFGADARFELVRVFRE